MTITNGQTVRLEAMASAYRSRRARLAALTAQLRAGGQTWPQIAARIGASEHVNARVAMRMAHGLTQTQVAMLWNDRWPPGPGSAGLSDKHISSWETWPQSGHEPSLRTLKRLAQLYQCGVGDLIDDGDFTRLDEAAGQPANPDTAPGPDAMAGVTGSDRPVAPVPANQGRLPGTVTPPTFGVSDPWQFPDVAAPLRHLAGLARQPCGSAAAREAIYEQFLRYLTTWADSMNRRDLLQLLAWAATAAAAAPFLPGPDRGELDRIAGALAGRARADEQVIEHIDAVLRAVMRQDDALGPQAALGTVLAQRELARVLLGNCQAALRPRLLSLFSNLSRFAGWLSFDLGDYPSAGSYYEQARAAAHEAENTELSVFVLCNLSHLATWRGQPRTGIDHAVAATAWAKETGDPLLRAYVADVAARAYARAGKSHECLNAFAAIASSLDAGTDPAATSLAYFYGPGGYANTQATCLLQLGDPAGARQAASRALQLIGPSFVRNRAFATLYLGNACLAAGDVDEAAHTATAAADLAARNCSARLAGMLQQSRQHLDPWRSTNAVRELDERLSAYGWGRSAIT